MKNLFRLIRRGRPRHQNPLQPQPFAGFTVDAARRYEGWYRSRGGQAVVGEEERALAAMLAHFPAAGSALEVGCGTGHFTRWFAGHGLQAVGVDAAAGMLAVAVELSGGESYARAVAEYLPFADGSLDVVAFITALEFLPDAAAALTEAARVARTGILLGVLNLASPLGVRRTFVSWFRPSVYRSATFYTTRGLRKLVRETLLDKGGAIRWTTAIWPAGMPHALRRLPLGGFIALAVRLK